MRRLACTAAIALSLSACVYHVDSLIPSGAATVDSSLLGTWRAGDSARAVITWARFGYRIVHTEESGEETTLFARSGELSGRTVLEIWPAYPGSDDLDSTEAAIRLLYVMMPTDDGMALWALEIDSLKAAVADGRMKTPYLTSGHDIILTAAASDLRAALDIHFRRPGALGAACGAASSTLLSDSSRGGGCHEWRRIADADSR